MRLVALLAVLLLVLAACVPTPEQQSAWDLVNDSRAAHYLDPLTWDQTAADKAQDWAEVLATEGALRHSDLPAGMGSIPWTGIGENVGRGPTIEAIHEAYMHSPGHKANVLGDWCCIGTGVAQNGDTTYTTHVYFRTN